MPCQKAMSEALFLSTSNDADAIFLKSSTPNYCKRASARKSSQSDALRGPRVLQITGQSNGAVKQADSQLETIAQKDPAATIQVLRGVVTGPARWRGSSASPGTPSLYCAVYGYTISATHASLGPLAEAPTDCIGSSMPPPKLISSTWGQGPLVIEGVPVPGKPTLKQRKAAGTRNPRNDGEHDGPLLVYVSLSPLLPH